MSNPESLDLLLSECTKSTDSALDAASVERFCTAINNDLDGPVTAARLLGHKIQSPQQQESLNALCVTDECVKKCGGRFQSEIGKFRFLNEMIKMISPKYFGDKTSAKVKDKCIELLYKWSLDLRHEPKILDAYEMLKRQGIIDEDPILGGAGATNGDVAMEAYPAANEMGGATSEQTDQSIFDDEDKSKLLAKLLRSKHPDDLQAANTLIKNMVKQDEEKQEKISQRYNLLETVRNNVKLLSEMLDCYQMAGGSSNSDKDIIKELYKNIDKERPKLFRLASETEDKDSDGMSQILQVNDDVVTVSQRYKQVIDGGEEKASEKKPEASALSEDLAGLDLGPTSTNSSEVFSAFEGAPVPTTQASDILALFSAPAVAAPCLMAFCLIIFKFLCGQSFSAVISAQSLRYVAIVTFYVTMATTCYWTALLFTLSWLQQPTQFPPSTLLNPAPTFSPFNTASPVPANLSHAKPSAPVAPVAPTAPAVTSNLDDIFSFNSPATSNTSTTPAEPSKTISAQNTDQNADDIGLLSLDSSVTPGLAAPLLPVNDSPSLFDLEGRQRRTCLTAATTRSQRWKISTFSGRTCFRRLNQPNKL
ncbi:GGA1 [Bugula neritina]|uniref:GGA1 n=1 Tax=Bugula neritina TaxID=10212 RepID=A0A7J7J5K7_BUGNE|nr:GGA1 [Bugula neritina]